ncbi:MAG: type II toxin-antitoxin system death-on-curing family toxin [Desulfotignum sp.]|nr:type II toxin-antitoxin system death-on-curing family toxin [Desulfotignum sp.]
METVLAVHDMQLAEHGGASGIRDIGLIESALARPANMMNYGDPDIVDLAASYAFGLAMNHGFIDGNKRTAYVVTRLFLRLHGMDFTAPPVERVLAFVQLGKGGFSAASFTLWLRKNVTRI